MRIGLFTDTYLPDINGVVSSTVTLKRALEKLGHTVFVITNHAGAHVDFTDGVLRLPGIRLKSLYGYKLSSPLNLTASDEIRFMDLDVIHLQTNFGVGIYGQMLGKSEHIPIVDTYHTMYEDYTHYINVFNSSSFERLSREAIRAASRKVCNTVQAVVAPSQKTKETLQEYGVEAPIYVVPTGLNFDAFASDHIDPDQVSDIKNKVLNGQEGTILGFLGRLAKEKSLEMPIEAIAANPDESIHLMVVGDGPDREYYEDIVDNLGVRDRVHFMGACSPDEVGAYYSAMDAFVSASLSETQGMTYLEAMACGRMVFGRRDDVLDGLIDEGRTGFYFDSKEELNEKIADFKTMNDTEKEQAKEACRDKVAAYSDETMAHKMVVVYNQAIVDYSSTFNVDKIRVLDDYVRLTLSRDASREAVRILVPMEDFFEQKINLDTRLDGYMVSAWQDQQAYYTGFMQAKLKAQERERCGAQIFYYCMRSLKLDENAARQIVRELEERNIINDRRYAIDRAESLEHAGYSKVQIKGKLYKDGLKQEDISEAVDRLSDDAESANAVKMARRLSSGIKHQSERMLRQTVMKKLMARGYSLENAREASEAFEIEEDYEDDALQRAMKKAIRLYSSKPEKERQKKIVTYLLRQGFSMDEINAGLMKDCEEDED